jgi:acetoin utilization protein AcuB
MKPADPIYRWMTPSPFTVDREVGLDAAHETMRRHGIRHLPVLDRGVLVGLVEERDIIVAERFPESHRMTVEDIMSPEPFAAHPSTPLADVAEELSRRSHRAAVIVESGNVVGVFTAVDALRALADDGYRRTDRPYA